MVGRQNRKSALGIVLERSMIFGKIGDTPA
jgi:hypothetical protein